MQLVFDDVEGYLRVRGEPYDTNNEDIDCRKAHGLFSETKFTVTGQDVEKAEIDLFGIIDQKDIVCSDLYFIGPLHHFNLPLIKNSWFNSYEDFLKLPDPDSIS